MDIVPTSAYNMPEMAWQPAGDDRLPQPGPSNHQLASAHLQSSSSHSRSPDFMGASYHSNSVDYRFRDPSYQSEYASTSSSHSPRNHIIPSNMLAGGSGDGYSSGMVMTSNSRMTSSGNGDGSWYGNGGDGGGNGMGMGNGAVNTFNTHLPYHQVQSIPQSSMAGPSRVMAPKPQRRPTNGPDYPMNNGSSHIDMQKVLTTYQALLSALPSLSHPTPQSPLDSSLSYPSISASTLKSLTEIASFGLSLLSTPPPAPPSPTYAAPPPASPTPSMAPITGLGITTHQREAQSGPAIIMETGMDQPVVKAVVSSASHSASGISCLGCGASDTPEWRRGPMGPRTLCNACGLVFAKLVRKRAKEAKLNAAVEASGTSSPNDGDPGSAKKKKIKKKAV